MTDAVDGSPSVLELSALLEKQNEVLSALVGELETCKSELQIFRNRSSHEISGNDLQDEEQANAENALDRSQEMSKILCDGSKKFSTLVDYLKELKKVQLRAENLSRELENTKTELLQTLETNASKQIQIDHLNELMENERKARDEEFSKLNDLMVDKTQKFDKLDAENRAVKAQLKILEDSIIAKEKLINDLTTATTKELAKRDEEDKVLAARLAVLADENMTLRTSLLALGANELSPQSKNLLEQQRKFIETLKSECEILMNRLVRERNEHRKERRQLRREIRTVNKRLECLISGKQEIIDV